MKRREFVRTAAIGLAGLLLAKTGFSDGSVQTDAVIEDVLESDLDLEAFSAWDAIPTWVADTVYPTPDITAVIQEVVDLGGGDVDVEWLCDDCWNSQFEDVTDLANG